MGGDAGGPKRKRIASAVDEESTKVAKKKKEISEKLSPEPKVAAARKRKTASPEPKTLVREEGTPATPSAVEVEEIMKVMTEPLPVKLSPLALELTKVAAARKRKTASPEPKTLVREEGTPATPSAVEVEEIMKVMTEPLPVKLSPLALELTKFFQKDKATSAEEVPALPKKRRIIQIADVIHGTPSPTPASRIAIDQTAETAEAKGAAAEATRAETFEAETGAANAAGAETGATEDLNLEDTLEVIDNILLKMAEEEAAVVTASTATEKGEKQVEETLEEKDFNFQDLLGQELTDAEK